MTMKEYGNESIPYTPVTAKPAASSCVVGGFRECSVCLEKLHDCCGNNSVGGGGGEANIVEQPQPQLPLRKMTFIVPCGHVFHTDCYHKWNQTRFALHQTLQCATCHGPSASSYYVVADYCCILCRQSLYQSQYDVSFTLPDKRLVHTECWSLFQQHGKPLLLNNNHKKHRRSNNAFVPAMIRHRLHAITATKQKQQQKQHVSFRGAPVTQVYRLFLFAEMPVVVTENRKNINNGLTSLLREMAQTLVKNNKTTNTNNTNNNNNDDDDDDDHRRSLTTTKILEQLLAMVTVTSEILTTVDTLATEMASTRASPTRQTAMAAMSRMESPNDIITALSTLLDQSSNNHHNTNEYEDESPPQQQQQQQHQRDIFEKACFLLAILCSNHVPNCARAVMLGGFVSMLLFGSDDDRVAVVTDRQKLFFPMGLRMTLTAFVVHHHPASTTTTMTATTDDDDDDDNVPVIVAAGGMEAILLELQQRPHEAHVQWIGTTFLVELLLLLQRVDTTKQNQQQQQRLPWWWRWRITRRRRCCLLPGWRRRRGSNSSSSSSSPSPTTTALVQCRTILDECNAKTMALRAIQLHSDNPAVDEVMNRLLLLLG